MKKKKKMVLCSNRRPVSLRGSRSRRLPQLAPFRTRAMVRSRNVPLRSVRPVPCHVCFYATLQESESVASRQTFKGAAYCDPDEYLAISRLKLSCLRAVTHETVWQKLLIEASVVRCTRETSISPTRPWRPILTSLVLRSNQLLNYSRSTIHAHAHASC